MNRLPEFVNIGRGRRKRLVLLVWLQVVKILKEVLRENVEQHVRALDIQSCRGNGERIWRGRKDMGARASVVGHEQRRGALGWRRQGASLEDENIRKVV